MAEAYVAEGPAGGNKIMGDFDTVAERLNEELDKLVTLTTDASNEATADCWISCKPSPAKPDGSFHS